MALAIEKWTNIGILGNLSRWYVLSGTP